MMTPDEQKDSLDALLDKLNRGLLILSIKKEMDEPGYTPMNRITKNRKFIVGRQEYCSEIIRVWDELRLTHQLLISTKEGLTIGTRHYQPEEIVSYYNGVFLNQLHQFKDKLLRLALLTITNPEDLPEQQKTPRLPKKVTVSKVLKKYRNEFSSAGIYDLLSEWSGGPLSVALSKRTEHHHFISTLKLNEDFLNITMSRIMLTPSNTALLSEYGKKKFTEIQEESFKKWKGDLVEKQQNTLDLIECNVSQIVQKIICKYAIPVAPSDISGVVEDYMAYLRSMDIINEASISKIDKHLKELIDEFIEFIKSKFGDAIISIYLVGSCARGEFVPNCSDINLYIILDDREKLFIQKKEKPPLNVIMVDESTFLSDTMKKHRFICYSDGVVLYGKEYEFEKDSFPKPGTLLALLLNQGAIDRLREIRHNVRLLQNNDARNLREYSIETAKIMLDFDFGIAMANRPYYSSSRKKKIQYTKDSWPKERRTITLEDIYYDKIVEKESFEVLISSFLENAEKNYQKMLDIEREIIEEKKEHE